MDQDRTKHDINRRRVLPPVPAVDVVVGEETVVGLQEHARTFQSSIVKLQLAGTGRVEGWLLGVADDRAGDVMDMLDEVEGPDYRRAPTTTDDGTEAVTYEYVGPVAAFAELATGRWDSREER